jgi:very-short-patch-repair endonuclease
VVALDALGRLRDFNLAQLHERLRRELGARGCRRLGRALELADPRAASPMESRLRLLLLDHGLPAPSVQHELVDEYGYIVAKFDLAYPEALLAIEYDGRDFHNAEFSDQDRRRDARTGDYGWHTMRFTSEDILLNRRRTATLVHNQLVIRAGAAARLRDRSA